MLTEKEFITRFDPFHTSEHGGLEIPEGIRSAAQRLPEILSGGIQRQHVDFSSPIGPLSKVFDTSRKLHLGILGFGNLPERFSLAGLASLLKKNPELRVEVTASDIYNQNEKADWLDGLRKKFGINFGYLKRDEYEKKLASEPPDILMIGTPPTLHADDVEGVTNTLGNSTSTLIGIEKPFMHLEARDKVREVLKKSKQAIHNIDFFNQGKAFLWLMTSVQGQEILGRFGKPVVINGNCVETMAEWRNWMFEQEKSGGGSFVDCGSHNVDMMYVFMHHIFERLGLKTDFGIPQINNAVFGRYHGKDALRETYNLLQVKWKDVLWNIQDGKALPKTAYNLEAMNENGDYLLVSVGTQFHQPFVLFAPNNSVPMLYTLDGPGVGYEQIFERLMVMSANPKKEVFPNPAASRHASFEVLLSLEQQVRNLQRSNGEWTDYNSTTRIEDRNWPHPKIHLPVTDNAFGNIKPLPN